MMKDAHDAMMRAMSQEDKVKKGWAHPDTLKKKGVAEGYDNVGDKIKALYQKIYDQGDDAIDYMYHESPVFAHYWDEYEGDLDSIIAEVDPSELQVIANELEAYLKGPGLAEGFKNTYNVGDRVDGPLGTGTIVAVSPNINVDGEIKVKLDDPTRAGEDGKERDTFVLNTTQVRHITDEASLAQMRDYFNQADNNTVAVDNEYGAPERKKPAQVPPLIQNIINKMYRVGRITPQEFEILKNFQAKTGINVGLKVKEAGNPYAIGMAQAMKSTGDKPPLKKSTINKAHEIARAIKKDQ
jgi:hypothetical protein